MYILFMMLKKLLSATLGKLHAFMKICEILRNDTNVIDGDRTQSGLN